MVQRANAEIKKAQNMRFNMIISELKQAS